MKIFPQGSALFLLCIISCHCVLGEIDCEANGGEVPVPLFNSPYTIFPNGTLCCPEYQEGLCVKDEKAIADKCSGQLVYEPCFYCKTCPKQAGESCGGVQNIYGTCDEGMECVVDTHGSGICYGKADKQVNERCGGSYGNFGRCLNGLTCTVSEEKFLSGQNIQGVCLNESTAQGACFKNCTQLNQVKVCGNDGRWYKNKCHLRQQNCIIPNGRQPAKVKAVKDTSICKQACRDVDLSSFPHARLSSYSFGVVNGSEATIVCEEGYRLTRGREKMTLRCGKNDQSYIWYNVVDDDGSEILRESWSAPCYPDQS